MENIYEKKHIKFGEILAYSLGLFGLQTIMFYLNSYFAEFLNMTTGANLAIVGIILLLAKVVSAIFDPIVGNLIEGKKQGKNGKFKPFIIYSLIPIVILTIAMFIKVPFRGAGLYVYIFVLYTLWCISITVGDVPSQGISAVLTPNPTERTNVISISNTFKSIGQSAPFVIVPVICLCIKGGAGFEGKISATEYLVNAIFIAIAGAGLLSLIFFFNKERVPYTSNKMSFKDMFTILKHNKPLMLIVLSYFLGFGRQLAMGIQVQAAVSILGSANKLLIIALPTGIGTMISMALCPLLIKKFNEKNTFIALSVYGFIISLATYFVGFSNIYVMLVFLFLLGLQFGAVNILPIVMVADSVDYYESKTGKRTEGVAYAVLTFAIKVTLAMGIALGLILLSVFKYDASIEPSAIPQSVKKGVYFSYTVVPGITSLLACIPILFYNLVGKTKKDITDKLQQQREGNSAQDSAKPSVAPNSEPTEVKAEIVTNPAIIEQVKNIEASDDIVTFEDVKNIEHLDK